MPVIDIHTHCSPRARDDPLGVAQALRGIPVGKNSVTNYRGLPAVSYHDMTDFGLQQEVCAKAGITGRVISNPFAAEVMTAISSKPAIEIVQAGEEGPLELIELGLSRACPCVISKISVVEDHERNH